MTSASEWVCVRRQNHGSLVISLPGAETLVRKVKGGFVCIITWLFGTDSGACFWKRRSAGAPSRGRPRPAALCWLLVRLPQGLTRRVAFLWLRSLRSHLLFFSLLGFLNRFFLISLIPLHTQNFHLKKSESLTHFRSVTYFRLETARPRLSPLTLRDSAPISFSLCADGGHSLPAVLSIYSGLRARGLCTALGPSLGLHGDLPRRPGGPSTPLALGASARPVFQSISAHVLTAFLPETSRGPASPRAAPPVSSAFQLPHQGSFMVLGAGTPPAGPRV